MKILPTFKTLARYLTSKQSVDFWVILLLTIVTILSALLIPGEQLPLAFIRYLLGFVYVLFLPGYALSKVLFPKKEVLDTIERTALSFGLSVASVVLIGYALNYTPWGIHLKSTVVALSLFTVICLIIAEIQKLRLTCMRKEVTE